MTQTRSRPKRALKQVEHTDKAVANTLALDGRTRQARAMTTFAEAGDQPPLIILSLSVVAAGLAGGNSRLRRTGMRMLTAHSLSTLFKSLAKDRVDRTRPGAVNEKGYRLEKGTSRDGRLRSMPSGHSAGTFAIAGAILPDYPRALVPAAIAATAIAAAQLPSKNHFLSDVLVGAGLGLVSAGIARMLIPPIEDD
ncbi:MAG: phosphatase PAP2 family protein [Sphingomicrobium sp.]